MNTLKDEINNLIEFIKDDYERASVSIFYEDKNYPYIMRKDFLITGEQPMDNIVGILKSIDKQGHIKECPIFQTDKNTVGVHMWVKLI